MPLPRSGAWLYCARFDAVLDDFLDQGSVESMIEKDAFSISFLAFFLDCLPRILPPNSEARVGRACRNEHGEVLLLPIAIFVACPFGYCGADLCRQSHRALADEVVAVPSGSRRGYVLRPQLCVVFEPFLDGLGWRRARATSTTAPSSARNGCRRVFLSWVLVRLPK